MKLKHSAVGARNTFELIDLFFSILEKDPSDERHKKSNLPIIHAPSDTDLIFHCSHIIIESFTLTIIVLLSLCSNMMEVFRNVKKAAAAITDYEILSYTFRLFVNKHVS